MQPTPKSTLAGIFCLGLSVILFEIALTRVFAIMMWHHFTYMVISIGLLGFGASGSLLTATRIGATPAGAQRALVITSLAYGISIVLAFGCATSLVQIDTLAIWQQPSNLLALLVIYMIIFVPFLLGGLGIGIALTRHVAHVNRLYFADLVGSGLGAGLSVLLMKQYGSSAAVVLASTFGMLAAMCFGLGGPRRHLLLTVPGLLLGGWLAIGFCGGAAALGIGALDWRVPYAPGKEITRLEAVLEQQPHLGKVEKIYSATAEVQVGPHIDVMPVMIGGDAGRVDYNGVPGKGVAQDGSAPTWLYRDGADLERYPWLDDAQVCSAYVVHKASGRKDHRVMVIGVGGGVDVMIALANGAANVTAVELNTAMVEMVTERDGEYIGGLFLPGKHPNADKVRLINSEGRAWLRSHDDSYDVIQMSGVDSYTALSTGAYTLSESYLYTVEAVEDFYRHLNQDGIVSWSRFIEAAPRRSRETLRLANIAWTALRRLGVADPGRQICVFQGLGWASTIVKKGPFAVAEVAALREFARRQGFVGLVHDPLADGTQGLELVPEHLSMLRLPLKEHLAKIALPAGDTSRVEAAVDGMLAAALRVANGEAASAALLSQPLQAADVAPAALQVLADMRKSAEDQVHYMRKTTADFALMMRGSDDERARFVAEYPFDISPSTDDRPFFFNYYRWSSLFGEQPQWGDDRFFTYQTEFPVGHMILLGSMLQILLLAAILIFLPLRKLAREGLRTPGAFRYFGYFGALGLGFMLIEIALMQKLVIFLGHPTYALSVVLVSLLVAAGTGSLLSGRITVVRARHLRWILGGIVLVVLMNVLAVNWLLPALLGQPLWARIAVVVLMLVPTGLVLGMPFPSGMRLVEEQCPHLVPWGWAINAFFSVFGSIFCIVLSMAIGFSNVFYVAIAVYAIGLLGMRAPRDEGAVATAG